MKVLSTFISTLFLLCAFQQVILATEINNESSSDDRFAMQERNKTIVVDCLDLMFNKKELAQARSQCFGDVYIQHSPRANDGADEIITAFTGFFAANPKLSLTIKRTAADGDLVWVHSHMQLNPDVLGDAVVDIFRVADGKLVEHWSSMQPVAETSLNDNTMF